MGDTLIALVGKDFVLVAADASANFSIISIKHDEDKILALDSHKLMAMNGEPGDRNQFGEYIQKNLALQAIRTGLPLTTHAAAHYVRGTLAKALRQNPYQVNILLAGYDDSGPQLYLMDHLSALHPMKAAAHGYGSYFIYATMDSLYREGMDFDQLMDVMNKCIAETKKRLVMNTPKFIVKVVDKDGTRIINDALVA
jgi:20S proteasome subunit beta 4